MKNLSLPFWAREILKKSLLLQNYSDTEIQELKQKLFRFQNSRPLISVVIPAWNEEESILHTLISLANTNTNYPVELLIIDNNSTDGTSALLNKLGIQTILEKKQGVGHARTCGLHYAKGKYLLSGDSDTLYPPGWISSMANTLIQVEQEPVYCVYGSYSFLPSPTTPRWQYSLYEMMSKTVIKKKERTQPFLNVLGFNCGFVREKGIAVNGYDIEKQRVFRGEAGVVEDNATEDGMMALRLMQAGGKIKGNHENDARVWTSDRRIQLDGGLKNALRMRIKKHLFKN
jgi:glycosyltransferase involved in cell wall biosynthesis